MKCLHAIRALRWTIYVCDKCGRVHPHSGACRRWAEHERGGMLSAVEVLPTSEHEAALSEVRAERDHALRELELWQEELRDEARRERRDAEISPRRGEPTNDEGETP